MADVYIKGYEIDTAKVAEMFGKDRVNEAVIAIVDYLDRRSYIRIDTGCVPNSRSNLLVIVLDMDSDEEKLKQRPLGEVDPTFEWMRPVLNGPSVWKKW